MRKYPDESDDEPELQWLEDSIHEIAQTATTSVWVLLCWVLTTIFGNGRRRG